MQIKRVYAKLGRAGLGNELFPYLRAVDASHGSGLRLVQPRWIQPRIGPWLRGERDSRAYWKIFHRPSAQEFLRQVSLDVISSSSKRFSVFKRFESSTLIFEGMADHFASFKHPGPWYRQYLRKQIHPGQLSDDVVGDFLSVHVRMGDFGRSPEGTKILTQNNIGTPIAWYKEMLDYVKAIYPDLPILLSSDGSNQELSSLLAMSGVVRTTPLNALDELFIMSRSVGILGSRSTFSSWGAFLGGVPLLVISGGNAYPPHDEVWEDNSTESRQCWLRALDARLQAGSTVRKRF